MLDYILVGITLLVFLFIEVYYWFFWFPKNIHKTREGKDLIHYISFQPNH